MGHRAHSRVHKDSDREEAVAKADRGCEDAKSEKEDRKPVVK